MCIRDRYRRAGAVTSARRFRQPSEAGICSVFAIDLIEKLPFTRLTHEPDVGVIRKDAPRHRSRFLAQKLPLPAVSQQHDCKNGAYACLGRLPEAPEMCIRDRHEAVGFDAEADVEAGDVARVLQSG